MPIDVPTVITSYFRASNANDIEALVACFAPNASVTDEKQTHVGTVAIKAWAQDGRKRFQFTTEPFDATQRPGGATVTAKLVGNFPGSPVDLDFEFMLNGEKITSLVIA